MEYGKGKVASNPHSSSLLVEERAGDTASTSSVVSPWALANQDGSKAGEDQRPKERREEPFPNNFIRESFRVAELVCGMAAVREPRDESFARGKIYLARGSTDYH